MHLFRKIAFILLLFITHKTAFSQENKIVVEQIQTYSEIAPLSNYWHAAPYTAELLSALDNRLFVQLKLEREKTNPVQIKILSKQSQLGKLNIDWNKTIKAPLHAYLEIYELSPITIYNNRAIKIEIPNKDSIASTIFITCTILNEQKEKVFQKTILLGLIPTSSFGIGYPMEVPVTNPASLYKAIIGSIDYLVEGGNELNYIEARVPTAYATDNFWMPFVHNTPRIQLDTSKAIIDYRHSNTQHLLRTPTAMMNKINLKDRSTENPYNVIIPYLKKRSGNASNEYYHVIQPLRDIKENIDYTLEAYVEFSQNRSPDDENANPIQFIPDSIHKIYKGKEMIGGFKVSTQMPYKNYAINANILYNGYDSTKQFNVGTFYVKQKIIFEKIIEGTVEGNEFKILLDDEIGTKTIFINNKIAIVVKGLRKPAIMLFGDQPGNEKLNDLLITMAYGELFQIPQ